MVVFPCVNLNAQVMTLATSQNTAWPYTSNRYQNSTPFNPDGEVESSLAARWRLWLSDFDTFLIASGIRDASRKRALLLYQAGSRVREIFHQLEDVGTDADYDKARDKLTAYFEPQKNQRYEVYKFRQTRQEEGETLDKLHTRLRNLSSNCEFTNPDF